MMSALMGVAFTGIGGMAMTRWTAHLLMAERHHAQQAAAIRWLHDHLEMDCNEAVGMRTDTLDASGTRFSLTTAATHAPHGGDPLTGQRLTWRLNWTDPWGQVQERKLQTYCVDRPRAY